MEVFKLSKGQEIGHCKSASSAAYLCCVLYKRWLNA